MGQKRLGWDGTGTEKIYFHASHPTYIPALNRSRMLLFPLLQHAVHPDQSQLQQSPYK